MRKFLIVLALCAGCSGFPTYEPVKIDYGRPVLDWPVMRTYRHFPVRPEDIARRCPRTVRPVGCAVVYFDVAECHIYLSTTERWVLLHEEAHCAGFDHVGESTMRDAWMRWKNAEL